MTLLTVYQTDPLASLRSYKQDSSCCSNPWPETSCAFCSY